MFIASIVVTILLYVFFAGSGCGANTFFVTVNIVLTVVVTALSISPPVQEANPKSGLTQAAMVAAYCAYLTGSAVINHSDQGHCNPLHASGATKTSTVVVGALFTFLAIAYSTSRAATQSKALVGKGHRAGAGQIQLPSDQADEDGEVRLVTNQPKGRRDEMRYQAIVAAVNAGSLPASVLDEPEDEDDEIEAAIGEERDDERGGTKYNVCHCLRVQSGLWWEHADPLVFLVPHHLCHGGHVCGWPSDRLVSPLRIRIMHYIHLILTCRAIISTSPVAHPTDPIPITPGLMSDEMDVYIGRSETTMWMRVISSWLCYCLYAWSL